MIVIDGERVAIPGLVSTCWDDDPSLRLKMGQDGRPRPTKWIRAVVLHTTRGIPGGKNQTPQTVLPGKGPPGSAAEANVRYWSGSLATVGTHLLVDYDGSVICTSDLLKETIYHAGGVNDWTIGIEIVQHADGTLYRDQLAATVELVEFIVAHPKIAIQRQVPPPFRRPPIPRLRPPKSGRDLVGVYGHRDQTKERGRGDPGDAIMDLLRDAGFETLDFAADKDISTWKSRQELLGIPEADRDGIPGPKTVALVREQIHPSGIWNHR